MIGRLRLFGLLLTLVATLVLPGLALAQVPLRVMVNGQEVAFTDGGPIRVEGRILVPVRAVSERLGATVGWEPNERLVIIQSTRHFVVLRVESAEAVVDGERRALDVPAQIVNNRVVVPVRFVAEALGEQVIWDAEGQTVHITASEPAPPAASLPGMKMPDPEQILDQVTAVLQRAATGAQPGKVDPAALTLLLKSQDTRDLDIDGQFGMTIRIDSAATPQTMQVAAKFSGAVRGEEGLFHYQLSGLPGPTPMGDGLDFQVALKNGQLWLKEKDQAWQGQISTGVSVPFGSTMKPVNPEKVAALVEAASAAGLIDLTMGDDRQRNGVTYHEVVLRFNGDVLVGLIRSLLQNQAAEMPEINLSQAELVMLIADSGDWGGAEFDLSLQVSDPSGESVDIKATLEMHGHTQGLRSIDWPADLLQAVDAGAASAGSPGPTGGASRLPPGSPQPADVFGLGD